MKNGMNHLISLSISIQECLTLDLEAIEVYFVQELVG